MKYPHKTIILNGRKISIKNIAEGNIEFHTTFEHSTITFIAKWLNGQKNFQLQTSGSTGRPKKIVVARDKMVSSAQLTIQALQLESGGQVFLCIDPKYIGGMMMLVRAIVNSMRIVAYEPTIIKKFSIIPRGIDLIALVPLQLQTLSEKKNSLTNLNRIKNIIVGGATINSDVVARVSKCNTNIFSTYGMTETISHIALRRISPNLEETFKVLPKIKIEQDARHCLVIQTPFIKKKIKTNDIVELIDSKSFRWLGRYDNIINSGGVKIIPEQVEKQIEKIAKRLKVKNRFYISSKPDRRLGNKVILTVEGERLSLTRQKLFLEEIEKSLPKYHAPKNIRYIQKFKVSNSKILRN